MFALFLGVPLFVATIFYNSMYERTEMQRGRWPNKDGRTEVAGEGLGLSSRQGELFHQLSSCYLATHSSKDWLSTHLLAIISRT